MVRLPMIPPRTRPSAGPAPVLTLAALGVIAGLTLGGCAAGHGGAAAEDARPTAEQREAVEVHEWDKWRIAGQPAPDDYDRQARAGTTLVVNLRTQSEIDDLEFDPRHEVESRGMQYAWIPMGGDEGYSPEQVEAFAQAVEGVQGPIMIHCASGGRARYLWAAYMVEEEGIPVDEAILRMQEVGGQPSLLERLLGHRLNYTLGDPLPDPPAADARP